jgi:hypothetical protein
MKSKSWLRVGIVVGILFEIVGIGFSIESKSLAQAAPVSTSNVDWSLFLPAGEGRFQTSVYCSACHTVQVIAQRRSDEAGWTSIVHRMIDMHAAPIEADDAAAIMKYLALDLSPTTPKLDLPIHINTAPKEVLNLMGNLSADDVQKIMDARSKAKIQDFSALEALVGEKAIGKYKSSVSFE